MQKYIWLYFNLEGGNTWKIQKFSYLLWVFVKSLISHDLNVTLVRNRSKIGSRIFTNEHIVVNNDYNFIVSKYGNKISNLIYSNLT